MVGYATSVIVALQRIAANDTCSLKHGYPSTTFFAHTLFILAVHILLRKITCLKIETCRVQGDQFWNKNSLDLLWEIVVIAVEKAAFAGAVSMKICIHVDSASFFVVVS